MYADLILTVSKNNTLETIKNAKAPPNKIRIIYHGFDSKKFRPLPVMKKENIVLNVGIVKADNLHKKGLELFVLSARLLPEVKFLLVGPWWDNAITKLKELAPPNVVFTGGLFGEELVKIYTQAKVYVQASLHESFGCSVAEAMLCECVPVVSMRAALPEVVDDCGLYVETLKPEALANRIAEALSSPLGPKARRRIEEFFPLENRRQGLLDAIEEL